MFKRFSVTVAAFAAAFAVAITAPAVMASINNPGITRTGALPSVNRIVLWANGGQIKDGGATLPCTNLPALTGDLTTSGCAATLASVISAAGPIGSATTAPVITFDAKGRLTTVTSATIAPPFSAVTGSLACSQHPALTGDVTASAGSCATTIANSVVTYAKIQNVSATQRVHGRNTAGAGVTEEVTASQVLDWVGSTRGSVLYRGAGGWSILAPATAGTVLTSNGAGADPSYSAIPGTGTVTNVATGNGVGGGPITTTGTLFTNMPKFHGRLTLTTSTPVANAVSSAVNLFYTPYVGQFVTLYDGTNFKATDAGSGDLNISLSASANWAANSNFDAFVGLDSATLRLCTGPAWATDTTRGTGAGTTELVRVGGIWLNAVSITCRYGTVSTFTCAAQRCSYLGTVRTTSSAGTLTQNVSTSGVAATLYVWNMYNRVATSSSVAEGTTSWTYTTATTRASNNSTVSRINFISGLAEDSITATVSQLAQTASVSGAFIKVGLALDSATVNDKATQYVNPAAASAANTTSIAHSYPGQLGFHFIASTETGDGTNANTFFGSTFMSLVANMRM